MQDGLGNAGERRELGVGSWELGVGSWELGSWVGLGIRARCGWVGCEGEWR